jgi:HAD superfamily hydrolase (TIGR01509 family)
VAVEAALLDVDGTLIDTNYQHALAWFRAFKEHGFILPVWRIHRAIGMGGDQLVPALVGKDADAVKGDDIREARGSLYEELIGEVEPLHGSHELISDLKERGLTVVLASSSPEEELDHYLELLDARELADAWTTKDDVEATKPAPDLVHAALDKAGTDSAVMVGDTKWDIEAAAKAGVETVCVLTGGWSAQELHDAGAIAVSNPSTSCENVSTRRPSAEGSIEPRGATAYADASRLPSVLIGEPDRASRSKPVAAQRRRFKRGECSAQARNGPAHRRVRGWAARGRGVLGSWRPWTSARCDGTPTGFGTWARDGGSFRRPLGGHRRGDSRRRGRCGDDSANVSQGGLSPLRKQLRRR